MIIKFVKCVLYVIKNHSGIQDKVHLVWISAYIRILKKQHKTATFQSAMHELDPRTKIEQNNKYVSKPITFQLD